MWFNLYIFSPNDTKSSFPVFFVLNGVNRRRPKIRHVINLFKCSLVHNFKTIFGAICLMKYAQNVVSDYLDQITIYIYIKNEYR